MRDTEPALVTVMNVYPQQPPHSFSGKHHNPVSLAAIGFVSLLTV